METSSLTPSLHASLWPRGAMAAQQPWCGALGHMLLLPWPYLESMDQGKLLVPAPEDSWKEPCSEAWLTAPPLGPPARK